MAIYRQNASEPENKDENRPQSSRVTGLGRGFDSLTGDNTPTEKKPLVVRRGAVTEAQRRPMQTEQAHVPKKKTEAPGVGGRVVIRTDQLPNVPLHSGRSARKGTTVLIRTERNDPQKRYRVNERIVMRDPHDPSTGRPIVINPRKKK